MNERAQRFTLAARAFLRANPRLVAIICLGCASVFALPRVGPVVVGLLAGETVAEDSYRTDLARQRQLYHAILPARDSMRTVAAKSRVVYVAQRRVATDAIAKLPPASVVGDTVTIAGAPYLVPAPVASFVTAQSEALVKATTALAAADTALAKTVQAATLSDSAATVADRIVTTVEDHEKGPGFFRRAWGAIKTPLAFTAGVVLGVVVSRAVP